MLKTKGCKDSPPLPMALAKELELMTIGVVLAVSLRRLYNEAWKEYKARIGRLVDGVARPAPTTSRTRAEFKAKFENRDQHAALNI